MAKKRLALWEKKKLIGDPNWYSYYYLKSEHWRKLRARVMVRDDWQCVECKGHQLLEVHHLTYARIGKERMSDLATLCHKHHEQKHVRE